MVTHLHWRSSVITQSAGKILRVAAVALGLPHRSFCVRQGSEARADNDDCMHLISRPCGSALLHIVGHLQPLNPAGVELEHSGPGAAGYLDEAEAALRGKPLFLCGLLGTAVLLSLCWGLMRCLGRPAEAQPEGTAASAAAHEESVAAAPGAQLSLLRMQKLKAVMEQVVQQRKLADIDERILAVETQIRDEARPSSAEVRKRTMHALSATNQLAQQGILSALAYAGPIAMQSQRIYTLLERRAHETQRRARELAYEEAGSFGADLMGVLRVEDLRNVALDSVSRTDMAILLASAFAPAQLRVIHLENTLRTIQLASFSAITIAVLFWDQHHPCESAWEHRVSKTEIYRWCAVDVSIAGICYLIRLWMLRKVGALLENLDESPGMVEADDPIQALCKLLDYYMTTGCEALARIDSVLGSTLYILADWSVVFSYAWMVYATAIVFNTPWSGCQTVTLVVLRARVLIFLFLLTPSLLNIGLFAGLRLLGTQQSQLAMISAADSIDELLDLGFPVASVIVQSMLVRNSRDAAQLQLRSHEVRGLQLQYRRQEVEARLQEVAQEQALADAEIKQLLLDAENAPEAAEEEAHARRKLSEAKAAILVDAERAFRGLNDRGLEISRLAQEQLKEWEQQQQHHEGSSAPAGLGQGLRGSEHPEDALGLEHGGERCGPAV